jgi:hypothetical protein
MPGDKRLLVGDHVLFLATVFGVEWAKVTYPTDWHRKKLEGEIKGRASNGKKWRVQVPADGEGEEPWVIELNRNEMTFKDRPAPAARDVEESDEEDDGPEEANSDTSDDEDENNNNNSFFNLDPDHEVKTGTKVDWARDISDRWVRDDNFELDQRALVNAGGKEDPYLKNVRDPSTTDLFTLGKEFLPVDYLTEMAAEMTTEGVAMAEKSDLFTPGWSVSILDVFQWIGVWMYMLAFPQPGDRRAYWTEPIGGYGPRHNLQRVLSLGENGEKGVKWFEKMGACFKLPRFKRGEEGFKANDVFTTRKFWYCLRLAFFAAVSASWLLCLDESMVRWEGLGMPGLMVVKRKPTPIGLELHTLCCAVSGILVWLEPYEGKEPMGKAKYCDNYGKSIALTLRMCENYFTSGKVIIADSWFGSVACAIALRTKGLFAVMNVKTATKNFPKDAILEEVGEIKGDDAESRKKRAERRGKSIAFTQKVNLGGGRETTLLAAGNNKKLPLMLITTCLTMLPGLEHNKVWTVNMADGSVEKRSLKTTQPEVHALYRLWMNIVDVHNKLRQGVVSMADVWQTVDWEKRHFAEGLGFWEVNVFKAFTMWFQAAKKVKMPHGDFRARLAWAFMTLGKAPYPADVAVPNSSTPGPSYAVPPPGHLPTAPLPGGTHTYRTVKNAKTCAYCGSAAYAICITCEANLGCCLAVCGPKSARKLECREKHAAGAPVHHSTFAMTSPAKKNKREAQAARKAAPLGGFEESSDSEEEALPPVAAGSPPALTRSAKKAKQERKAARRAERDELAARARTAEQAMGRAGRQMARGQAQASV